MTGPCGAEARLRRAWRAGGLAAGGFGLLVFGCVFLAVAAPRENLDLRTRALQQALTAATPAEKSVYGTIDDTGLAADTGRLPDASVLARAEARLAGSLLRDNLPLTGTAGTWSGLTSPFFPVAAGLATVSGELPPQLELAYREKLAAHATLVAGRFPVAARLPGNHATFQVAVTTATAARFGLRAGSLIQAAKPTGITLVVSGIVRPDGPGSAFWTADPAVSAPSLTRHPGMPSPPPYWAGAGLIGAAEVPLLEQVLDRAAMTVSWDFPLATGSVTADGAPALSAGLASAASQGGLIGYGAEPVTLSSGVTAILARFISGNAAAGSVLRLLAVALAVIATVVVLLGGRLLARRRRAEFAVQRARGASRAQIALLALRAAAAAAVPAAAAGTAAAVAVTRGYPGELSWWFAGAILLAALACPPLIAFREHRVPGLPGRSAAPGGRAAWRRAAAEIALVAAAIGGLVVLRQQSTAANAYTSLAPVLVAVPAAIVVMRCYPLLMRGLFRLAGRRPGVTAFTGLARAARTSPGTVVPGFALVLALTVAAFGIMVRDAVVSGEVAASWQQTGADAVIDVTLSDRPLTPVAQRAIAAVPGVTHVATVGVGDGIVHGSQVPVAVVDPAEYGALAADAPLPSFPAASLERRPAGSGAVPALASPAAASAVGRGATLQIALRDIPIHVAGTAPDVPGVAGASVLVLPAWAMGSALPQPGSVLVTGPRLDSARLAAVVRRDLPGATVALRSAALAALATAPLPHAVYLAIVSASAAAAVLALLVLLMAIADGAGSRRLTTARLRVMGLRAGQARWIGAAETIPLVLAAAAGGVSCAVALGPLTGVALNLSAFTGGVAVQVPVRWALLGAAVAGLVVLALLALAGQAVAAGRRGDDPALAVRE